MAAHRWLRSRSSDTSRTPARHPAAFRRLAAERLEDREVPATVSVAGATLTEIGSPSPLITAGSGGLDAPIGITLGPDGNVYVAGNGGAVHRYNASTGAYISTFVTQGSGGLAEVNGLAFGPDGHLYVASGATDQVLRYNGITGAFLNAFVPAGSGGLDNPRGITFGQDGNLCVSSELTHSILRYQGPSGATPGAPLPAPGQSGATFVTPNSGGLYLPGNLILGPDGNLYASGRGTPGIQRFDGATGASLGTFVPDTLGGLTAGRGMAFDQEGRFYVGDRLNAIRRYDSQGKSLGDLIVASVPTPSLPLHMVFDAQGALLISCRDSDTVVKYDRGVVVSLSEASPTPVTVDYQTADGTATTASDYHALSGTVTFQPGQTSRRVLLATRDDLDFDQNETFAVQLSNATGGAVIGTGTGTVTVADEDGARQVTIADTSAVESDHAAHFRGNFIQGLPGQVVGSFAFGPDGNIYASINPWIAIDRYDGTTGAFMDRFVADGRLKEGRDIAFRAGYLYVVSEFSDEVLRYNAGTGAFVDVFVTGGSGGLDAPHGLSFGPDANGDGVPELYVSGRTSHSVVRYDGATGAPLGTYVSSGSGGLSQPLGLAFDPSGSFLDVTSTGTNQVLKYNAQTGAFVGVGASGGINSPNDVTFGPDGLMYVSSGGNNRILRFTADGTYVDDYVPAGAGGLTGPACLVFGPDGDLYVASSGTRSIMRFGTSSEAVLTLSISAPSALPVTVTFATADGTAAAGGDYAAATGTVTFAPGSTTATVRVPLLDDAAAEPTETFAVDLSAPAGAVTVDSQALVTITDDDGGPKFVVVDDSAADRAYDYGLGGAPLGSTPLNNAGSPKTGSTAPRGAASDKAGTTRWVVDANTKVYVYSPAGALLGHWTAGSTKQPEGVATDGTDVWLVDASTDRVYRYAAAAARRDRTQSPASSFALAASNTNPKDIVTDGASFWVVDDGATDRVFKYSLAGALLGSWTIDPANASPTGLTIDPNDVRHVWVVDAGTDRVYRYDDAAGRTSGSQSAASSFALASGNTNPQGIADPPTGGDTAAPAGSGARPTDELVTVRRPRRGEAAAAGGPARVGADWFPADDLDRSPVVVDQPVRKPRRA